MAEHWDKPLSRVLAPKGQRLTTLRDAANFILANFATTTHSATLEHAIVLLQAAAESGSVKDRTAATDQVALVLRLRGWM
jgi:hypothetical protein